MYKYSRDTQIKFEDFNQPMGLKMNPNNRWVKKAELIPWETIEVEYAKLFPSKTGMPAKPLRMALGSLLIQKQYGYSDEELVEQIRENPYYQYFIGLSGYEDKIPFLPSLMVEFRKRLTDEIINKINEMTIEYNAQKSMKQDNSDDDHNNHENNSDNENSYGSDNSKDNSNSEKIVPQNSGTLILDATCAPQNVAFPQDINLLNETREKCEALIDRICHDFQYYTPRMYREKARKDYLALAKCKKRSAKRIKKAIGKQLRYIRRDMGYIEDFLACDDVRLTDKETKLLVVLKTVYKQQLYMFENNTHSVPDRIVSISQPYIRPIVRGKAKSPVEFGAKLDLSIDENGMSRIEKLSFDAYNEAEVLVSAAENYKKRTGHYPERILADQIYRNRSNHKFCSDHGIRLSGKPLGRPKKQPDIDKKTEYKDNTDRIEIERKFSLSKRKFGLGLLLTKREDTTKSAIALSILAMNVDRLLATFLRFIFSLLKSAFWGTDFCSFYLVGVIE